jgi:alpha-tubulin suppressor-like RCC1 family protein
MGQLPKYLNPWLLAIIAGLGGIGIGGCSGAGDTGDRAAESPSSQLQLWLVTQGQATYRLRHATFEVRSQAGDTTLRLESEDDPDASVLTAEMAAGWYSVELEDGWVLERLEAGGYAAVHAALLTQNPVEFRVRSDRVTQLSYVFTTLDGVVRLGQGALDLGIGVIGSESLPSPCDLLDPGSCPEGQSCLLVDDSGQTFCADDGPLTEGSACETEQCVAGAQCLRLDGDNPGPGTCRRFCDPVAAPPGCFCRSLAFSENIGVCMQADTPDTVTIPVVSDGSWSSYSAAEGEEPPAGWNTAGFDDSSWSTSESPNRGLCDADGRYSPVRDWELPATSMWDVADQYSAFFRKVVTLPEHANVQRAMITVWADDDVAVWVNGVSIYVEPDFGVREGNTIIRKELDLGPFLEPGANLVAIHAQDTVGVCRDVVVSGSIEVSSDETTSPRAVRIAAGNQHTCVVLSDGTARCWGANALGALGNGATGPSICVNNTAEIGCATRPLPVSSLTNIVDVSLGNYHTCATSLDGSLSCWGLNDNGQLGLGTSEGPELCTGTDYSIPCSQVPAPVTTLTGVRSISAADESHTCAVLADGSVHCWGLDSGQFGGAPNVSTCPQDGWEPGCSTTPIVIPDLPEVESVHSSAFHTCALATDRTVWCWGYGLSGEIGNGSVAPALEPVRVSDLSEVELLASGSSASCALREDDTIWCWGSNNVGQLGLGSTSGPFICAGPTSPPFDIPCAPVPVQGPNLPGVVKLTAGGRHMCALLSDGTVACWGANDFGQLGLGTASGPETCYAGWLSWPVACATAPVVVPDLSDAVDIAAGAAHTCAVLADGAVRCWGYNVFGQLGNGTTDDAYAPATVVW